MTPTPLLPNSYLRESSWFDGSQYKFLDSEMSLKFMVNSYVNPPTVWPRRTIKPFLSSGFSHRTTVLNWKPQSKGDSKFQEHQPPRVPHHSPEMHLELFGGVVYFLIFSLAVHESIVEYGLLPVSSCGFPGIFHKLIKRRLDSWTKRNKQMSPIKEIRRGPQVIQ